MHILLVEDDAPSRAMLRTVLEGQGYTIAEAGDGVEALRALGSTPFDLVITDILMPKMDGYRLCYEIRRHPQFRLLPVIVYTATYTSESDEQLSLELGACRFLRKSATADALLAVIPEVTAASHRVATNCCGIEGLGTMHHYSQGLVDKLARRTLQMERQAHALRESELRSRLVFNASNDAMFLLRFDPASEPGRFLDVNEAALQLLGFTREELLARSPRDLDPPDQAASFVELLDRLRAEKRLVFERTLVARDGRRIPTEISVRTFQNSGEPMAIAAVRDITERKKLEQSLAFRELQIGSFFTAAAAGLAILDRELRYVRINEMLARVNGPSVAEHLGKTVMEVLPKLAPAAVPLLQNVLTTREPALDVEYSGETPARPGVIRDFRASFFPLLGTDGQIAGLGVIVVEVTERKLAEAALRESEERFRQLAENIDEVFWMSDPAKNTILYVSPAYERIWGRTSDSLYANPRQWLEAILAEDRSRVAEAAAVQQSRGDYDETYRIVRPDDSVRWIRDRAFPVRNAAGEVYRVVGTAVDITEQKQLEDRFLRAQRMEAIGTLASGIAHDLNNILAPMLMAAGLLKDKLTARSDQAMADLIQNGAQRGAGIIRQLLTFSRGLDGVRANVQIRHLLNEMVHIVRETFPRNVRIERSAPADLWTVRADATQLHQVLMNLCVNARDAMPRGGT